MDNQTDSRQTLKAFAESLGIDMDVVRPEAEKHAAGSGVVAVSAGTLARASAGRGLPSVSEILARKD